MKPISWRGVEQLDPGKAPIVIFTPKGFGRCPIGRLAAGKTITPHMQAPKVVGVARCRVAIVVVAALVVDDGIAIGGGLRVGFGRALVERGDAFHQRAAVVVVEVVDNGDEVKLCAIGPNRAIIKDAIGRVVIHADQRELLVPALAHGKGHFDKLAAASLS